jgi:hypothetical protein
MQQPTLTLSLAKMRHSIQAFVTVLHLMFLAGE